MSNEVKNKLDIKFLIQIGLIMISAVSFILTMNYKIDLLRKDMQYISKIVEKYETIVDDLKTRVTILEVNNEQKR